jgi:putative SOS response-associated peptidase YedK
VNSALGNRAPVRIATADWSQQMHEARWKVVCRRRADNQPFTFDARLMRCYPVSTRINHVANDDAECSRPVELAETQHRLFGLEGKYG